jgi:hypothetical protein
MKIPETAMKQKISESKECATRCANIIPTAPSITMVANRKNTADSTII